MRLQVTRSANAECFYIVKSIRKNGRNTNQVVERLGNREEVLAKSGGEDPYVWGKAYAARLTKAEQEQNRQVIVRFSQSAQIAKDETQRYNGGYLFLQKIYNELKLGEICKAIRRKYHFDYDINEILSRLVYCRIIRPQSKLGTYEYSQRLLEKPSFELHQVYRALDVIAENSDMLLEKLYQNSNAAAKRNTAVLYYDCTNYYFEIEQEKGMRKYGFGKDGKPLPLVEMGLLMDGSGLPLSFCIHSGNENEQTTLKPLEEQILSDFDLSQFIVCTDAGLSSAANKFFNSRQRRDFVTSTSIKMLPEDRKRRLLQRTGWRLSGAADGKEYDIEEINASTEARKLHYEHTFYKEEWFIDTVDIYDDDLKKTVKRDITQRLIITFSLKYKDYLQTIRSQRIERAKKLIAQGNTAVKRRRKNDVREFIKEVSYTGEGVVADKHTFGLNEEVIEEQSRYDGFYAVYTSLDTDKYPVSSIIAINHGRWEIEECFRIMKSEFEARPVYLQKDNRIKAHFMTCYIALLILRILEQRLEHRFTYPEIIDCLAEMDFCRIKDEGYIPAYTRTHLTDALHDAFGFRTDYEILSAGGMKKIYAHTKSSRIL